MPKQILVADDDSDIAAIIAEVLTDEGYLVHTASNGLEVLDKINTHEISLLILDIMMPEMDGLEVLTQLKRESNTPVMILSAKGRDIDKVIGLQIGADDYMAKPFSLDELVARVSAHLRREHRREKINEIIRLGTIELNKSTFQVFVKGTPTDFSTKEFLILSYLIENKGQVLTREQIYEAVWKDAYGGDMTTVTVHIKNIRSKLGCESNLLETVWGVGYRMTGGH
ncbi:MAG: DNA-binding response regulator [Acetobacterium sp. MES1]|uniref:response regulator transcription factor n=1 Tax=Acetobacterium sp. MES1 TaxID=1899015 RepID=UPI000B9D1465|nr:response regulator transcription factor [Acetobacterium sp. MES1]OXS26737.1 MAG: DNA-binding response regulator [Acetobacterium sp. MES1]